MSFSASSKMSGADIPVIDMGPLRDNSNPEKVAKAIHDANRSLGFLYVSNHGLSIRLKEKAREAGLAFFRQPETAKREITINQAHRGFLGVGGAKMYEEAKADLKESFVWGAERGGLASEGSQRNRFQGENQWPSALPDFKRTCTAYFDSAHQVARQLLRAFAIGLALPEETFLAGSHDPISRASLIYYPPQSEQTGRDQFGVAPHTDFGVLTVLAQDHVGGLQVQTLSGDWIDARPIEGTLVVNVGDLLERWTNGRYHSTPHRVVNASGQERLSLVLAYDPEFDILIDSTITCASGEVPAAPPIKCGDYLEWRFRQAFSYRNS